MNYDNMLWKKIEEGISCKNANHLLVVAQKEFEEIKKYRLSKILYTAYTIVDFMRQSNIPYCCSIRLPSLTTSYLLDFVEFCPLDFCLKPSYFFDSNHYVNFDVSSKSLPTLKSFILSRYKSQVAMVAMQDKKGVFLHPSLFVFGNIAGLSTIEIANEKAIFVKDSDGLEALLDGHDLFKISLVKLDLLDTIHELETKNNVSQSDYNNFLDTNVYQKIADSKYDFQLFALGDRKRYLQNPKPDILTLAKSLSPNLDEKYLPHFICRAILLYKQVYLSIFDEKILT